jgi:DNA-binding transcriptional MerR regulator
MALAYLDESKIPKYSVKQAAELTGLTLNQVRLWERRYHLVSPQRADNGYRLYTQEDLDILRYALYETQRGISIQVIAERVQSQRDEILQQTQKIRRVPLPQRLLSGEVNYPHNFNLMIEAIRIGDPLRFERYLVEAQAGHTFAESLQNVDLPVLAKIGDMTMDGSLNISGSHLASAVIRRRILSHVQNLGIPRSSNPVILACAPNDYHELGLLCCLMELTQRLIPTLYLGSNVPATEIQHYAPKIKPTAVLLSVIAPMNDSDAETYCQELKAHLLPHYPVAAGGYEAEKRQDLFEAHGIQVLKSVNDVLGWSAIFR